MTGNGQYSSEIIDDIVSDVTRIQTVYAFHEAERVLICLQLVSI